MQPVHFIRKALLVSLLVPTCLLGASAPMPIGAALDQADLVIFAKQESLDKGDDGTLRIKLSPVKALKGAPVSGTIAASISDEGKRRGALGQPGLVEPNVTRLWFLQMNQKNGLYTVIPMVEGDFSWSDLSLDTDEADWPNSGTLKEQALDAVVNFYLRPRPGRQRSSELTLLVSLEHAEAGQCESRAMVLAAAPENKHRILGIAAGLACGGTWALETLRRELTTLKAEASFERITNALRWQYRPSLASSLKAIEELIGLRTDAPGLDDSIAASVVRLNSKSALPLMAQLLDSRDTNAQLRAASFFAHFTLFADSNGNISSHHRIGPWHTSETKAATPRRDSQFANTELVAFWRVWWQENRSKIPIP